MEKENNSMTKKAEIVYYVLEDGKVYTCVEGARRIALETAPLSLTNVVVCSPEELLEIDSAIYAGLVSPEAAAASSCIVDEIL